MPQTVPTSNPTPLETLATPQAWAAGPVPMPEGIPTPLKTGRQTDSATSQPFPSISASGITNIDQEAGQYASAVVSEQRQKRALVQKYSSLNSLEKSEKVEALKNLNLDPRMIENPYDALSNSLWRWKQMASTQGASLDEKTRGEAAGNYYDKVLAPLYEKLGTTPMPKNLWMQKAYGEALKYDTANSYHSALVQGVIKGYAGGISVLDRVAGTSLNMFGEALSDNFTELKATAAVLEHPNQGMFAFYNTVRAANATAQHGQNFFDKAREDAEKIPLYGYIDKHVNNLASTDQFWHDVVPTQGFTEVATSTIVEQAMQLPLYAGIGAGMKALGFAGKGIPYIANLSKVLEASPVGRKILPLLFAGAEGAVTGTALTAPGEDWKREAWQSALGFAAGHTLFSVAGNLIGKAGSKISAKLGDILEGPAKEDWDQHLHELELGTQNRHLMSDAEQRTEFKKIFSGYIAAMGKQGMLRVFNEALVHLGEEENHSPEQVREMRAALMKGDRAHWTPVLNVAAALQRFMGDGKPSELTDANRSLLKYYFNKLVDESAGEMPVHVAPVQKMASEEAEKNLATPAAQRSIARKAASLMAADAASGVNKGKPQQFYVERATAWYKEQNVKGAAKAATENTKEPVEEVKNVASRRQDVKAPTGTLKQRSQYYYDKAGKVVGYSLGFARDYKVYATKAAKAEGFGNLKDWMSDLSDEDFVKDLHDWFYPKDLKDGGFVFEHSGRDRGAAPNFLAFMYNYKDQMPKELETELRERLLDQMKVQKHFDSKIPEERQLRYYAIQMHNHVDDFLSALPQHKGEFNLFRSTQSDLLHPTKYQLELHEERMTEDRKNLQYMYQKQPEVLKSVLASYDKLAAERYKLLKASMKAKGISEEATANALRRQDINYKTGEMMTGTGNFENWRF